MRLVRGGTGNFGVKPGLVRSVFHKPSMSPAFNGQLHDHFVFWGLAAIAVALSVLMAGAWLVRQRTGNSGWVDTIWTFSLGAETRVRAAAMSAIALTLGSLRARDDSLIMRWLDSIFACRLTILRVVACCVNLNNFAFRQLRRFNAARIAATI